MFARRLLSPVSTCPVLTLAVCASPCPALPSTGTSVTLASASVERVALKDSDYPNVKTNQGTLGKIGPYQMNEAFTEHAFALLKIEAGLVPLDTPAGLGIIRRME